MNPFHALPDRPHTNRIRLFSFFALTLMVWSGRLKADDGYFDNLYIGNNSLSIDGGGNLTTGGNIIGSTLTTTTISLPTFQLTTNQNTNDGAALNAAWLEAYQDLYIQSGGATGLNLTAFDDGTNPGIVNIVAHADNNYNDYNGSSNYTSAINLVATGASYTSSQINLASVGYNGTISLSAVGDIDLASNCNINLATYGYITLSSRTISLSSNYIYITDAGLSPGLLALDSSGQLVNATISGGMVAGGPIGYSPNNNTLGLGGFSSPYGSYALAVGGSAYVSSTLTAANLSISNAAYSAGVITAHGGARVPAGGDVSMGSFTSGTSP